MEIRMVFVAGYCVFVLQIMFTEVEPTLQDFVFFRNTDNK